MGFQEQYFMV